MSDPITLPLWLMVILCLTAAWALYARLLVPGVRWFLHRRANQLIGEVNKRLDLQIPAITLAKRQVIIDRLVYDPQVIAQVAKYCQQENVPHEVAMAEVQRYAREVAPAFNAFLYFRIGSWLSKRIVERLYRVRLGQIDEAQLKAIDPNASVVLVMNHRSNVDYVLITYLVLESVAVSYAVGEWARVWPLQQLVWALGAYFVRRNSRNPLYRRVLERYVQIAVEGGATQAIFPEGGLTRSGALREPRIGLLDYMLRDFDPEGPRDIVFVPISINYDRVLEDRTLIGEASNGGEQRLGLHAVRVAGKILLRSLKLKLQGRLYRFGYACANFGTPISLRAYAEERDWHPDRETKDVRVPKVIALGEQLMAKIGENIPVLPVALLASIFSEQPDVAFSRDELTVAVQQRIDSLRAGNGHVYMPRNDSEYFTTVGLRMLTLRRLITSEEPYAANPEQLPLLRYYANSISQLQHGSS
jgi:glycerol-3-phosphate O-acyltransferase